MPIDAAMRSLGAHGQYGVGEVPRYGLAADRSGQTSIQDRPALRTVRNPIKVVGNPNALGSPQPQAIQAQPANLNEIDPLTGEQKVDWSQGQNAPVFDDVMNNPNSDPWAVRTGFIPAFMEVYSDLLKGMTPHQVGSLASQVFLKMGARSGFNELMEDGLEKLPEDVMESHKKRGTATLSEQYLNDMARGAVPPQVSTREDRLRQAAKEAELKRIAEEAAEKDYENNM